MALKFYLGTKDNDHIINVETNASFVENIASFDTGSFTMEWNLTQQAIAPYTKFFIEDTSLGDTWCFVIVSDEVEVVRKITPIKYLHHLLVKQNTYALTKNIIRNSVFSQPMAKDSTARFNISGSVEVSKTSTTSATWKDGIFNWNDKWETSPYGNVVQNCYQEQLSLPKKEKIKNAFIEIHSFQLLFLRKHHLANDDTYYYPQSWLKDNHNKLYLKVDKYVAGTLTSSLPVEVDNKKTKVQVDPTFFNSTEATYKVSLDTTKNSLFNEIDLTGYTFDFSSSGQDKEHNNIFINIQAVLHLRTYYYTLYDVLETLCKQYQKKYNSLDSFVAPYTMPTDTTSEVYKTLKGTIAPNFNFTSKDLYSCVYEVLSYIDAIPTLDANGVLGYVYLNDHNRSKETLQFADKKVSLTEQNYANTLIANYQNGRQEESIFYPARNVFARVGSSNYGIPQSNDYSFNVAKSIDYIDSLKIILDETTFCITTFNFKSGNAYRTFHYHEMSFDTGLLDITSSTFENSIYRLLPMSDPDEIEHNQLNSFYFSQGDTKIQVGDIVDGNGSLKNDAYKYVIRKETHLNMGIPFKNYTTAGNTLIEDIVRVENLPAKKNLRFNIEYHAVYDGRVSQESTTNKVDGEIYVNQSNANVSLNRMGNNMQGLIAKMGNENKNFTLPITSYGSRLKVGSLWVDDDGNKYIANTIKTTFSTSSQKVFVECEFTKNFNMLSQFTQIDQERRFYEISEKLTSKGYENITEFIYFTTKSIDNIEKSPVALSQDGFKKIIEVLASGNEENNYKADFSYIHTFESLDDTTYATKQIYCPMHSYGNGNSISFEMGFESPLNAGNRLTGSSTLNNKTTLYTAENGFADKISIACASYNGNDFYAGEDFPNVKAIIDTRQTKNIFAINNFEYFKKPNEILHVNYSVAFMPYKNEEIYFGDEFINGNLIINGNLKKKKLYLYISNTEQYSIIDNQALGTRFDEIETSFDTTSINRVHIGEIDFTPINVPYNFSCKSWAIADENGRILLAVNQTLTNAPETTILVFTSRYRKN